MSGLKCFINLIWIPVKHSPAIALTRLVGTLIKSLLPAFKAIILAKFIDTAIGVFNGSLLYKEIITSIILLFCAIIYENLYQSIANLLTVKMDMKLRMHLRSVIVDKRAKLKYSLIEDNDTWDLIARVCASPDEKFNSAFAQTLSLIEFIFTVSSIIILLSSYIWWVGILIFVMFIPLVLVSVKGGKKQYESEKEAIKLDRRHEYLFKIMQSRDYIEERTIFNYTPRLLVKHSKIYMQATMYRLKTEIVWYLRGNRVVLLFSGMMIFVITALVDPLITGVITVGIVISLIQAVQTLSNHVGWHVNFLVDRFAKNCEYIKDYFLFMNLEETKYAECIPEKGLEIETVEFKNVWFKYPKTDKYILNGINMKLEKGKHYSFVGANGTGKTTITKLITGLYDNYEGEILINGVNLKDIPLYKLKSSIACVFQDFNKYEISLKDNVVVGTINDEDDIDNRLKNAIDTVNLNEAAKQLPDGINTYLGKIKHGGQDLSGGQWQRVALARSIIGNATLRILDEPTASLDPISESEVYSQFENISKGVTTIFISHRLGSTKLADKIFVISDGVVKEEGTHESLIDLRGLYLSMYESQRGWYV